MLRGFPEETYWYTGLLVLFLVLAPPYLWRLGGGMIEDGTALAAEGVAVTGEITGTSREFRQHPGDYVHYVHYAFVHEGQRFEGRDITESGIWLGYQGRAGQPIEVTYLPADPTVSALWLLQDTRFGGYAARSVGALLGALGVFGLLQVLRHGWKARRGS